jgi:phosphotransferase system IIB component
VVGDVEPPGQSLPDSKAFIRALQATGFITSIDTTATRVTIHFDPTVPNSKFKSAGMDLTIPDGAGPGVELVLNPLVIPDETFPAHAHCRNLIP